VGSEMCIRDRALPSVPAARPISGTTVVTVPPAYAFQYGGTRWDPCEVVHYQENVQSASDPVQALTVVGAAFAGWSQATGIPIQDDGATTALPSGHFQDRSAAGGWSPVLVAWAHRSQATDLENLMPPSATGMSWQDLQTVSGVDEIVGGFVFLNADWGQPYAARSGTPTWTATLLHELGHMAGLGHVWSPPEAEQMSVPTNPPLGYGPGDSEGLRLLGRSQGCLPARG